MTKLLSWEGAMALAVMPVAALAQSQLPPTKDWGGHVVPGDASMRVDANGAEKGTAANPDAIEAVMTAAPSTALLGSLNSTAVTPTSGGAALVSGVARIGPLVPQLGRAVRVVLKGTWVGSFALGTSVDGCATINPLTVGGQAWGVFTANANEPVDVPTLAGVGYCATAAITSGTLSYSVRQ
jgi:hypothetical protein